MKIAFQADADFNEDIVNGVKRRAPEIVAEREDFTNRIISIS